MAPVPPNHVASQDCECGCLMRRLDSVEVFNRMQEPVHATVVRVHGHAHVAFMLSRLG